jgi:hypothetical protein
LIVWDLGYATSVNRAPLPPLPPLPGGLAADARPGGRDLLDVLDEEHELLAALCARLADGDPVASVLTAMLSRHLSAEEQYLYPAVRAVVPGGAALADAESAALRSADGVPAVRAHIDRCDRLLFPPLRAALDETARIRLGNRAVIAGEAAPTRPHPWTPSRPPWNKLVDPLVGVLDKVRDVASGRPTRLSDLTKAGGGARAGT